LKSNQTPSNIKPHLTENSFLLQIHPVAEPIPLQRPIAQPSKPPSPSSVARVQGSLLSWRALLGRTSYHVVLVRQSKPKKS
ncbi:unnamed protein product, partial [Prunus brigantina]